MRTGCANGVGNGEEIEVNRIYWSRLRVMRWGVACGRCNYTRTELNMTTSRFVQYFVQKEYNYKYRR